jgi:hypothetical protein
MTVRPRSVRLYSCIHTRPSVSATCATSVNSGHRPRGFNALVSSTASADPPLGCRTDGTIPIRAMAPPVSHDVLVDLVGGPDIGPHARIAGKDDDVAAYAVAVQMEGNLGVALDVAQLVFVRLALDQKPLIVPQKPR